MFKRLLESLLSRKKREWTAVEIRELIVAKKIDLATASLQSLHRQTPHIELVRLCLAGEIAFHLREDNKAENLFKEALALAPGFSDAHYGLSLLMHSRGEFETAFQHALFAHEHNNLELRYIAQLGLCHLCLENYSQAEELLRQALQQSSADATIWNNYGVALLAKGRTTEARSCFHNALKLDVHFKSAQENLQLAASANSPAPDTINSAPLTSLLLDHLLTPDGDNASSLIPHSNCNETWLSEWEQVRYFAAAGHKEKAFLLAERLLLEYPDSDELASLSGNLYRVMGESDSGLAVLQAFLIRKPESAIVNQAMGNALLRQSEPAAAEHHLRKAFASGVHSLEIHKSIAEALSKQDRYIDALPFFLECQKSWPSDVMLGNLALAYYLACDYSNALNCFNELTEKDPNLIRKIGLQSVYAQTLAFLGQVQEAISLMDEMIGASGSSPYKRVNRAFLHLLMQDFESGWDGYRYRQLGVRSFRVPAIPEWQGQPLLGKTIVVLAEQGLGDQVMFASCLPDLVALHPNRVVVEAINRVAPTLARSFPECEIISSNQDKNLDWLRDLGQVDYYVPIAELPRHFRRSLSSFPSNAYLKPDPNRVKYWRGKLEELGAGPYFGTSWRGGSEVTRAAARTLSPELLHPLTTAIPSTWISLQYGDARKELEQASASNVQLIHWSSAIADLDEFSALVAALDGVFTVCNTTVHYSGAVGQRTWVLAPTVPEWRYGLNNSTMPWYPCVEVLRQPTPNAWAELITMARDRLIDNYGHHQRRSN